MVRVSGLSSEVWGIWGWLFVVGFVLLSSTAGLWFGHVLFLLPLILGIVLVGLSAYHAEKRYRVLKRQARTTGGD
jgi:ABC-type Fe3+ transport system permease subunit